jgi:cytochrome b5
MHQCIIHSFFERKKSKPVKRLICDSLFFPGGPKVYNVTNYLDDHPGGAEVLLDVAGQNADEFFEDIGHSKEARVELQKHLIGHFKLDEAAKRAMEQAALEKKAKQRSSPLPVAMGLVVVLAAVGYAMFFHPK